MSKLENLLFFSVFDRFKFESLWLIESFRTHFEVCSYLKPFHLKNKNKIKAPYKNNLNVKYIHIIQISKLF